MRPEVPRDWWKSAVVYQIYPRSFADSDGDGVGDLGGILGRLDYLQHLGVDVVWLSPIYPSPMDDNGYDISDFQDVDPMFGTLEQLDELIAALHARGMRVVMDLVVNHTSSAHSWFMQSRSSRDDPKRDWYWWRPPRPGQVGGEPGAEPTNWGSVFSGPAWEWDDKTGEYYLHNFAVSQPELNWENPQVRQAIYAMMRWWLDRGVDGFRMDVINLISKNVVAGSPGLLDGVVGRRGPHTPGAVNTTQYGDQSPHVLNGPRIHEYLQEMHREVFSGRPPGLINVGEMPGSTVEQARLYTDPARGELDMIFQFEHVDLDSGPQGKWDILPLTLPRLKRSLGRWQEGLAEVGWNSLYLGNHDQPRSVSRFGSDDPAHRVRSAKALATLLHLHRGTPYIYQGDELGMTNTVFEDVHDFRDIESVNHYYEATAAGEPHEHVMAALRYKSRDNARTPMQWDRSPNAGFTTGKPWLPVNPNHVEINAVAQAEDPHSVLNYYRSLILLRHQEPALAHGEFRMLIPDHEQLYAFTRTHEATCLLVEVNLSNLDGVRADLPGVDDCSGAELVLANVGAPAAPGQPLAAWEARVHRMTTG